jgi:hypothetical protein
MPRKVARSCVEYRASIHDSVLQSTDQAKVAKSPAYEGQAGLTQELFGQMWDRTRKPILSRTHGASCFLHNCSIEAQIQS